MLLDKDFVYDYAAGRLSGNFPVHQIDCEYRISNHPDDVAKVRSMLAEVGVEENFYFFTTCSKRVIDECGGLFMPTGHPPVMAASINGTNFIAFDMAALEFMLENDMTFEHLMEHELIHLWQLNCGKMKITETSVLWEDNGQVTEYPAELLTIMDPLKIERSLAFQLALPWEREAYAPEVARGGTTPRANAIRLADTLSKTAHAAIMNGNRALMDLVLWSELAMTFSIFKYKDYETADEQFGYMDLDDNIVVRTNQMREVVKSLMCNTSDEFQAYCQRTC